MRVACLVSLLGLLAGCGREGDVCRTGADCASGEACISGGTCAQTCSAVGGSGCPSSRTCLETSFFCPSGSPCRTSGLSLLACVDPRAR